MKPPRSARADDLPNLPPWWELGTVVAVAALAVVLIWGAIAGGNDTPNLRPGPVVTAATVDPTDPSTTPADPTASPTPTVTQVDGGTVSLRNLSGRWVSVPVAAADVARAAALAQFTGDFTPVAVPEGSTPSSDGGYPSAEVVSIDVVSKSGNQIVFRVDLNPDPAQLSLVRTDVTVVRDAQRWLYQAK